MALVPLPLSVFVELQFLRAVALRPRSLHLANLACWWCNMAPKAAQNRCLVVPHTFYELTTDHDADPTVVGGSVMVG